MIIFDLDDCLANCDHRKHLLDPNSYRETCEYSNYRIVDGNPFIDLDGKASWRYKSTGEPFHIGFKPFYEACGKDDPIDPTIMTMKRLSQYEEIQIWSGRCESVKEKTIDWIYDNVPGRFAPRDLLNRILKMRPIGDSTPEELLKSKWMNESLEKGFTIDYVFDAHKKSISMWRSRGVFVFNCIKPKW